MGTYMKIHMSKDANERLLHAFNDCIMFRSVSRDSATHLGVALLRYASGKEAGIYIPEDADDLLEVEFFSLYDALKAMLDSVCMNAVNAREYAYNKVSPIYREFIEMVNQSAIHDGGEFDSLIDTMQRTAASGEYVVDRDVVAGEIKSKLDTLSVDCSEIFTPQIRGPERLDCAASYNVKTNTIHVYTGTLHSLADTALYEGNLDVPGVFSIPKDKLGALVAHVFLHELVHLCEPCIPEMSIVDHTTNSVVQDAVAQWASMLESELGLPEAVCMGILNGTIPDITGMSESVKDLTISVKQSGHDIASHCTRFKLTLLYISSVAETRFIRPEFIPQIEKEILGNQMFLRDAAHGYGVHLTTDRSESIKKAYAWEKSLYSAYNRAVEEGSVQFRPKSYVAQTDDLLVTLEKIRRKLYHNPVSVDVYAEPLVHTQDDMFYTVGEIANLMSMRFVGDAFAQIMLVLKHRHLTPSQEIQLPRGIPFLGIMDTPDFVKFIYSDSGDRFTEVTLEEAWWLLAL